METIRELANGIATIAVVAAFTGYEQSLIFLGTRHRSLLDCIQPLYNQSFMQATCGHSTTLDPSITPSTSQVNEPVTIIRLIIRIRVGEWRRLLRLRLRLRSRCISPPDVASQWIESQRSVWIVVCTSRFRHKNVNFLEKVANVVEKVAEMERFGIALVELALIRDRDWGCKDSGCCGCYQHDWERDLHGDVGLDRGTDAGLLVMLLDEATCVQRRLGSVYYAQGGRFCPESSFVE